MDAKLAPAKSREPAEDHVRVCLPNTFTASQQQLTDSKLNSAVKWAPRWRLWTAVAFAGLLHPVLLIGILSVANHTPLLQHIVVSLLLQQLLVLLLCSLAAYAFFKALDCGCRSNNTTIMSSDWQAAVPAQLSVYARKAGHSNPNLNPQTAAAAAATGVPAARSCNNTCHNQGLMIGVCSSHSTTQQSQPAAAAAAAAEPSLLNLLQQKQQQPPEQPLPRCLDSCKHASTPDACNTDFYSIKTSNHSHSISSDCCCSVAVRKPDVVCSSVRGVDDGVIDVWIMASQSNCVGSNGPDGQVMPEGAEPWPGRILAYNNRESVWCDAVPNIHLNVYGYEDAYSCGPDMAFARTLIETGAAHKVGLIPTAMGGTSLYDQWAPGDQLWCNMCNDTRAAMTALGKRGRLRGIIWIQGESDAAGNVEQALGYGTNLTAWLTATRSAMSAYHPQLPLMMVVMATRQRHSAFPFIDIVRAQQQALELPGLLKIDMAGFEFFEQDFYGQQQLIHLSKAGCCALGVAMAYEVLIKVPSSCQMTAGPAKEASVLDGTSAVCQQPITDHSTSCGDFMVMC